MSGCLCDLLSRHNRRPGFFGELFSSGLHIGLLKLFQPYGGWLDREGGKPKSGVGGLEIGDNVKVSCGDLPLCEFSIGPPDV